MSFSSPQPLLQPDNSPYSVLTGPVNPRFLEIVPALAQLIVDKTDLPISSATLKALSDDEVIIGLSTSLTVPGGLTVKLDPIDLFLHNKFTPGFVPYTMVSLDGQTVKGKTDISVENMTVGVGDRDELNKWLNLMLFEEETDISVKGNTTAHLGALNFNVKLEKTVRVAALNELKGFKLESTRIRMPAEEDGTNLVGSLTLPNWSDLTIGLGNLTFNAWAGDLLIGSTSVYDVVLPPGNSTLPFRGELFLDTIMDNLLDILGSQAHALTSGVMEIGVSGNKTTVDGEHITYLERVLNEAHIMSQIPIMQLISDAMGSIRDGDLELNGLGDVLGDGVGSLLDGLFGGDGEEDAGGEEGDDSNLLDEIFGNLDEEGGNSTRGILGDLLDSLDMRNGVAKRKFIHAIVEGGK